MSGGAVSTAEMGRGSHPHQAEAPSQRAVGVPDAASVKKTDVDKDSGKLEEKGGMAGAEEERITRAQRKPSLTPDRFKGDVPWREYKVHFESCAKINAWSTTEKAYFLAASLNGQAQHVLEDRSCDDPLMYDELTARLDMRFGTGDQAETFLSELRSRTRRAN